MAMLVLKENASRFENVAAIDLTAADIDCKEFEELSMNVTGWGIDTNIGKRHEKLWTVRQSCIPTECCKFGLDLEGLNEVDYLCVGDKEEPRNSGCHGDSGGNAYLFYVLTSVLIWHLHCYNSLV